MNFDGIEKIVTDEIMTMVKKMDLKPIVKEVISSMAPKRIEINIKQGRVNKKKDAGQQHCQFVDLLKYVSIGLSTYMVGPAGSGKTRAAAEVAKLLELKFYSESVCQQSSASLLKGYMDAHGKYVTTNFRKAFESGGVFLLDEIDAGNPNVLTVLNAAIAVEPGETVSFPDKMVKRHDKFTCIAAANTFGKGADRQYVGRNPLDAASLDRFVFIDWIYDEDLEKYMANEHGVCDEWLQYVLKTRKAVEDLKLRYIVSPRATIFGGKLIQVGYGYRDAAQATIFKGMDADSVKKLTQKAPVPEKKEGPKIEKYEVDKVVDLADKKDQLLQAIRLNTLRKHGGLRNINELILCIAKKDSGDYVAGGYYLRAYPDKDDDILMMQCYGPHAGKFIAYTNRSNFSKKFVICSAVETEIWERRVSSEALSNMADELTIPLKKWKSENE